MLLKIQMNIRNKIKIFPDKQEHPHLKLLEDACWKKNEKENYES